MRLARPLDLAGPRRDGRLVVAAAGSLQLLSGTGTLSPTRPSYRSPGGEEPYITLTGAGCRLGRDVVLALRLKSPRGIIALDASGRARLLARLSAPGLIDGVAFDGTGDFSRRVLVTINAGPRTTVDAVDCRGRVQTITAAAPKVEGGIAVAPRTFGRFAGELIAPDELSGNIFAISPAGRVSLVARSGVPHGPDLGVESAGFVPAGARDALLADRRTPGNRHPGDDVILHLSHGALVRAGVRAGDLLVAGEGGAQTVAVRCGGSHCSARRVATGPAIAHGEGHLAFIGAR